MFVNGDMLPTISLQVEKTGLVSQEDHVMISADKNTSLDSEYSIVIRSPDASEPTVVTQQTSTSHTTKETLTKAPKEKTTMEKYQDLDEDLIDEAAMEGRSSSSSGSDPKNKSPIASGSGIGKKLRQREQDEVNMHVNNQAVYFGDIFHISG